MPPWSSSTIMHALYYKTVDIDGTHELMCPISWLDLYAKVPHSDWTHMVMAHPRQPQCPVLGKTQMVSAIEFNFGSQCGWCTNGLHRSPEPWCLRE